MCSARLGCHGTSAIVALTAQNTRGVTAIHEVPPEFVRAQLEAVFDDIGADAAKTGMLFSTATIEAVADFLEAHRVPLVVDPVMIASSGARLLREDAVAALRPSSSPAATARSPLTGSSTASVTSRSPCRATRKRRPTARAAPTRRPSRPCSPEAGASKRRRAEPRRLPPRPCGTASPTSARGTARLTCSISRPSVRLSGLGEFGLLAELARRGLAEGIGDDTAVLDGGVVVTQDALVEGVHFRPDWISWRDLGYKAAAVNLSDLAAAGAEPEALIVSLALPGDLLVVTGPLGGSAAGLRALELGLTGFDDLVRVHNRPPFRLDAARVLAPVAHALIDLSDGIASDAQRLAEQSGCALELDVERLPLAPRIAEVGPEPFWTMGEDYELLAALAPEDAGRCRYAVVGRCVEGSGVRLLLHGEQLHVTG